jgi:ABC-type multidrug transport system fused ATPase/permease subunit
MNTIRLLLKYVAPYKWQAVKNVLFNILSAFFALFTYTMVAPFLKLLFEKVTEVQDPGGFVFSLNYLIAFVKFHFYSFVGLHGIQTTLLLVCGVVIIASFLKNGFIYMANSNMAYIRAATVRDLRKKIYDKVLRCRFHTSAMQEGEML